MSIPQDPRLANTNTTTSNGEKTTSLYTAITDPVLMPTLDEAPPTRYLQSFLILFVLLGAGFGSAYLMGVDILQTMPLLLGAMGAVLVAMWLTGTLWIDYWELVLGYWWLSLPAAGAAGVAFVLMQEQASSWVETD